MKPLKHLFLKDYYEVKCFSDGTYIVTLCCNNRHDDVIHRGTHKEIPPYTGYEPTPTLQERAGQAAKQWIEKYKEETRLIAAQAQQRVRTFKVPL